MQTEHLRYTPEKTNETRIRKKDQIVYITFPALEKYEQTLVHAFSTKKGGFSTGMYESMNLGIFNGDSAETVLLNHQAFCDAIGIRAENLVLSHQQHTTDIRIAAAADRGRGLFSEPFEESVDGFITNEKGVGLCLTFADCVPVYLYDPVKEAIGLTHSGWKGTLGQISAKAVRMMLEEYGSRPEDIIAVIGPSICGDCYEVSTDLYESFSEMYTEEEMREIFRRGKDEGHVQLSLWKAISISLQNAGAAPENIHVTDLCTNHNPELLFSHRFTKGRRGNLAAVLMLLPEPEEDLCTKKVQ